jgi:RNA polymerase sigma-70 factor, ECF subfamily
MDRVRTLSICRKEPVPTPSPVENPTSEERFDSLFNSHHDIVYRYCVRRLGVVDADDAAADVFAVAWRRIDDMPSNDLTRAWLIGVAYKVVGNRYRSRRRQLRLWTRLVNVRDSLGDAEGSRDVSDDDIQRLHAALGRLSTADQELLRLSAWDGLSRVEIAQVLNLSENAVDQRLFRARSRLKDLLDRSGNNSAQHREATT